MKYKLSPLLYSTCTHLNSCECIKQTSRRSLFIYTQMSYNGEKLNHIKYGEVKLVERIYTLGEDVATHAVIELSDGSTKKCPISELSTDNYFYSERYGERVLHKDHGTLTIVGKELDIESGVVTYKLEKKDGAIVELTGDEIDDIQSDVLHQLFFDVDGCSYKVLRKEIDLETSENRFILLSEDGIETAVSESEIEENYTKKRQKDDVSVVKKEISELKESVVGEITEAFSELVKTINEKTESKEQSDKNIIKILKRILKKDVTQDNTAIIDAVSFVQKSVDSIDYNASFDDISRKLAETIVAVRSVTESVDKKDVSVNIMPIVNKLEKIQRLVEAFKPFEIPQNLIDKDGIRVTLPKRLFTHDGRLKVDVNAQMSGGQMISVGGSNASSEPSEEELSILQEIAENTENITVLMPDGIASEEKQTEQLSAINSFKIPAYDTVDIAYNGDGTVNTKTYKLVGSTVAVMTYVYSGGNLIRKTLL